MNTDARRGTILALLAIPAMVLACFAPQLPVLGSRVVGMVDSDAAKHVWSQWWVWDRLLAEGRIPLDTTLIFFPDGGRFFSLETANTLFSAPLRLVLGAVPVYNVLFLVHAVLAGWAAYWLLRGLSSSVAGAAVGGVALSLTPWILGFGVVSGVSEVTFVFPMYLALGFGIRACVRSGPWNPVLAAGFLALQAFACWSHAILVGLLVCAALPCGVVLARRGTLRLDRRLAGRLLLGLVVLAVLVGPLYHVVTGTVSGEDSIYQRRQGLFGWGASPGPLEVPETNAFGLAHYVLPLAWGARYNTVGNDHLLFTAYAGLLLLGLAGLGWSRARFRVGWALGLAALFVALSLGPRITLDPGRSWPGWPNPVFLAFYYFFPIFHLTIHEADRFSLVVQLCLTVAAAPGVDRVLGWMPERRRGWATGVLAVAVGAELVLASPVPWPFPDFTGEPHAVTREIVAQAGEGAVLDLPSRPPGRPFFDGDIFLQQTFHRRPIPYFVHLIGPSEISPSVWRNRWYQGILEVVGTDRPSGAGAGCDTLDLLAHAGFRWVVLREENLAADRNGPVAEAMGRCLVLRLAAEDRRLYEIPGAAGVRGGRAR